MGLKDCFVVPIAIGTPRNDGVVSLIRLTHHQN